MGVAKVVASATGHSPPAPAGQPSIGVGTWAWGNQFLWGYRPERDDQALEATFHRAIELGLRFFDTADSYGTGRFNGRSEALLGRFAASLAPQQREALCVATKLAPFPWRLGRQGFARPFAASLRRLEGKLDRVQLHWSTARYAPWQEGPLLQGLADLVERGAVASVGVSNVGPRRLGELQRLLGERGLPLASLQVQLSLLSPQPVAPGGLADLCRQTGIELIAYSPLALGLLTDATGQGQPLPRGPRGLLYRRLLPRIEPLLVEMRRVASSHDARVAEVAINWCRSHGALPIPGLRSVAQAEMAAAALSWTLSDAEVAGLDRLAFALPVGMPANPFQSG
ncbi:aldo/keto reductase [Synechococcus sp. CS-1325]|uniref:aldo/keto reductase n=1 Tax=unclassified Synechococcus TaxID=2626047 RepID=UPI000DB7A0AC|nr:MULTISPECIES: aldo/keto reductase [unclassified Synechococcus]MCT0198093.1 aldo/keto reductase [Synechococcus sp. CS-1325]MCT0213205.1 aldo/keto reductase [Synechococcus sp. CS-1326]PZU97503.1 MAG: oxidoreductase [Cyanobium sp.]